LFQVYQSTGGAADVGDIAGMTSEATGVSSLVKRTTG
jgi:hypothetical protein